MYPYLAIGSCNAINSIECYKSVNVIIIVSLVKCNGIAVIQEQY